MSKTKYSLWFDVEDMQELKDKAKKMRIPVSNYFKIKLFEDKKKNEK